MSTLRVRTPALWSLIISAVLMASQRANVMGFVPQHRFVASPATLTSARPQRIAPTASTVLQAASSSVAASEPSALSHNTLPRLTDQEQQTLLQQTVELRRIRAVEKDLALQSKTTRPLVSVRCQAAGYGDDMVAFEAAVDAGHRARETLVTRNMGLVHYCLKDILGRHRKMKSLSREDLVQEGAIGLARAVDRWNPDIGGKFSTYAVYWIRAAILRCIAERDDLMRVPEHVTNTARKVSKAAQRLGLELDGENIVSSLFNSQESSWEEAQAAKALAVEAGLSPKQLAQVMKVQTRRSRGMLSFETWMQLGKDYETDLVSSADDDSSLKAMETEQIRKTLSPFLRPREMEALSLRYGLWNGENEKASKSRRTKQQELALTAQKGRTGEAMSFVEVGKNMKVSAEYGRRLCHAALDKLRNAVKEGALEPQLLM